MVTSLAPLGQTQPSVQEPQRPLDSIARTLSQSRDGLCKSFARLQRPGALER